MTNCSQLRIYEGQVNKQKKEHILERCIEADPNATAIIFQELNPNATTGFQCFRIYNIPTLL